MAKMNRIFVVFFTTLGTGAFLSALFAGATWHYGTAILCLVMSLLFISENKSLKTKQS